MKRLFLIAFIFISFSNYLHSQNVFSNVYVDLDGNSLAFSGLSTPDKGYIICGNNNSGIYDVGILLFKIDSIGNMLWQKVFDTNIDWYSTPARITESGDSAYFIAGSLYDEVEDKIFNLTMKVDYNGDTIWTNLVSFPLDKLVQDISPTIDKGCIITYSYPWGDGFNIVKIDSTGTMEWSKKYIVDYLSEANGITQCNDSGYLVCGGDNDGAFLMKLNSNGEVLWTKNYWVDLNTYLEGVRIEIIGNHVYVFCLVDQFECVLLKTDISGNLIWSKLYFTLFGMLGNIEPSIAMKKDYNGGLLIASESVMASIDTSGAVRWSSDYITISQDVISCRDGGGIIG